MGAKQKWDYIVNKKFKFEVSHVGPRQRKFLPGGTHRTVQPCGSGSGGAHSIVGHELQGLIALYT